MRQVFLPAQPADPLAVQLTVLTAEFQRVSKVGVDLEQVLKLGIERVQAVVQAGAADDDQLELDGDRLGLEAGRA